MKIGYASLAHGVPNTSLQTCMAKSATPERLLDIIQRNLASLSTILAYNHQKGIKMFRKSVLT